MSGQMRWSGDEDGKAHLDDSILLAYIRQQSLGKNELDIHQHIAHCAECQERYNELRQTSIMLEDTLYRSSSPLLKEDVAWDWLQSPEEAQLAYQRRQHERLHEDLASGHSSANAFTVSLTSLVGSSSTRFASIHTEIRARTTKAWASPNGYYTFIWCFCGNISGAGVDSNSGVSRTTHNPFQPSHLLGGITTAVTPPTVLVSSHSTSTPAVGPQSGSGATLTPGVPMPTIFECDDKTAHRFSICGKNFKPSTRIELVIQFGDGSSKTRHPVWVDASGEFQDSWSISSCKDAPITISAQNMAHPSVNSVELQNIQYGKCSPNPMQRAGTNHH